VERKIKIAVLDDYQQVALATADWSAINELAEVTVFHDHFGDQDELARVLFPFAVICVMRERTPLNRGLMERLPGLKLIVSTGRRNASIDMQAAAALHITVKHTGYVWSGAPELTWALLMALARNVPVENANLRNGRWQTTIGTDLSGKTIGIMGLGNIGRKIAAYATAFDMRVIAWSTNLTPAQAQENNAEYVDKEKLFKEADFISIHLVLSERTRGIVSAAELGLMKPGSFLINTSRGPLIEEAALIKVLEHKKIAGAALDVFNEEPLPVDHPFRTLQNVLATPHIGYVTRETYRVFYEDTVKEIKEWLADESGRLSTEP
jgi:phosphoglycerate dehydrogenase-like enzyme